MKKSIVVSLAPTVFLGLSMAAQQTVGTRVTLHFPRSSTITCSPANTRRPLQLDFSNTAVTFPEGTIVSFPPSTNVYFPAGTKSSGRNPMQLSLIGTYPLQVT